jgi:hypothetical protein
LAIKTRRIRKELNEFFESQALTEREKAFILGCIAAQQQHPQLTSRQWQIVCDIEKRYKHGKSE